jgi:hypothetical protein
LDTSVGFGRGSAVREYWLKRCQGFSAVRGDGSHLGRVKRVETQMEGTFLRLTGLRARTFPLSAIETVWPSASVLVISDEHVDVGSEASVGSEWADERSWTEDTLPWWELVDGVGVRGTQHVNATSQRVRPRIPRFTLDAIRMTPALSLERIEALPKTIAAWATNLVECAENLVRTGWARATPLVERGQNLVRAFAREVIRANRAIIQPLGRARIIAQTAVIAVTRRMRLRVARSLFRMGVWVGGSNAFALDPRCDRRVDLDERDTEEIDLGSR